MLHADLLKAGLALYGCRLLENLARGGYARRHAALGRRSGRPGCAGVHRMMPAPLDVGVAAVACLAQARHQLLLRIKRQPRASSNSWRRLCAVASHPHTQPPAAPARLPPPATGVPHPAGAVGGGGVRPEGQGAGPGLGGGEGPIARAGGAWLGEEGGGAHRPRRRGLAGRGDAECERGVAGGPPLLAMLAMRTCAPPLHRRFTAPTRRGSGPDSAAAAAAGCASAALAAEMPRGRRGGQQRTASFGGRGLRSTGGGSISSRACVRAALSPAALCSMCVSN